MKMEKVGKTGYSLFPPVPPPASLISSIHYSCQLYGQHVSIALQITLTRITRRTRNVFKPQRGTMKTLIDKRNDGEFTLLWDKISEVSEKHDICLKIPQSSKRKKQENTHFKDSVVMSTLGMDHNPQTGDENLSGKHYWKSRVYLQVVDVVTERLEHDSIKNHRKQHVPLIFCSVSTLKIP